MIHRGFSANFLQGKQLLWFLPCFSAHQAPFWKEVYCKKKEFAHNNSKFFPLKVDPFQKGTNISWDRVTSFESVSILLHSFPTSGDLCPLLITFANSLDPGQAWQNVGPDLDPTVWHWWYSWKIFLEKSIFFLIKKGQMTKMDAKLPSMKS